MSQMIETALTEIAEATSQAGLVVTIVFFFLGSLATGWRWMEEQKRNYFEKFIETTLIENGI
jgi:hypothetical protein